MSSRLFPVVIVAFLLPIGALLLMRGEEVQELVNVDPNEAPGRVLFFTSPT